MAAKSADFGGLDNGAASCLPGRYLSHLQRLTALELVNNGSDFWWSDEPPPQLVASMEAMQQLSCLQNLQRLVLGHIREQRVFNAACKVLTRLTNCTAFTLDTCDVELLGASNRPGLEQLTAVQELTVSQPFAEEAVLRPGVLGGMNSLRRLDLSCPAFPSNDDSAGKQLL